MTTAPVRDSNGRFVPGHPPTFEGFKPGQNPGGRPQHLITKINNALEIADRAMPEIITMLVTKAKSGDVESAKYLVDHIYGKANQPLTTSGEITFRVVREYNIRNSDPDTTPPPRETPLLEGQTEMR